MKKNFLLSAIFTAIVLVFAGCNSTRTYDKNGVSFSYPGNWTITTDNFDNSLGYLTVERNGNATATIAWLENNANIAAELMLRSNFSDMQNEESITDFVSSPSESRDFGPYPAKAATYTASVNGVPHSGAVWVFKADGRIVNIGIREKSDTHRSNRKGFEMIESTFMLK